MAENNRKYTILMLVIALIGAVIFYGCGSATSDRIPDQEYSISGSYSSPGLSNEDLVSTRAVYGPTKNIYIYSESDPNNCADIDETKRTFILKNLKPGNHYLVFKYLPYGSDRGDAPVYIYRTSNPIVLTESAPSKEISEKLAGVECDSVVYGKLTNAAGQPINPTPSLTLWGQTIEVNGLTGEFVTPKMPGGTIASLVVEAVNYRNTSTPIEFNPNPAYYEISAVETTSNNVPPIISLTSKNSQYNIKSVVTLTAVAEDADGDDLEFEWTIDSCTSPNQGYMELSREETKGSSHISEYYWNAPEEDCLATISVKVTEKSTAKLTAKAKLKLQIGTGNYSPSSKPYFVSTTIYPDAPYYGNRKYTITAIATDSDGDILTQTLVIKPNGGILNQTNQNTWVWTTEDLEKAKTYTMFFEARDMKKNVASVTLENIVVNPTRANLPPTVVSQSPAVSTIQEVTSGASITLVLKADDPEKEKLEFNWNNRLGQLKESSNNNDTASATWVAPYINVATITYITVKVNDPEPKYVTATFTIKIIPDPNKKAPNVEIKVTGTSDTHNGIPLFKAGETVTFHGLATDTNRNLAIDQSHFTWYLIDPKGTSKQIANRTNTANYTINNNSEQGNYLIKLSAIDLNGITGDGTADFRVNKPPVAQIICNDKAIGTSGRCEGYTESDYKYTSSNGTDYDVYNIDDKLKLVASATDEETPSSVLEVNSIWQIDGTAFYGKEQIATLTKGGLNTISLVTRDSKDILSASSTYSFYVNTAPTFDIATTTKNSFINSDSINMNIKITDDVKIASLAIFISRKSAGDANYSEYELFNISGVTNPVINFGEKTYNKNIPILASTLLPTGTDFKIKIIAEDDMGVTKESIDDIKFSIVESHLIKDFVVASGTYSENQRPYTFDELEVLEPLVDSIVDGVVASYVFEAKQKFSIRSGSIDKEGKTKWQDDMDWLWYDSFWDNGKPGNFTRIGNQYVDNYTLNGYSISDNFGTHTIRLEGKSKTYGIVASKSIDIFINSTPKVSFNNKVNGTIRFDTGSNATFTVALEEDNKNEKIGLRWTIRDLSNTCEPVGASMTFESHRVPATSDKTPVDMAGSSKKNVTINWSDITDTPLPSGAKRVFVCAYDGYGKAATQSIDILVNTLPVFNVVVEGTDRKIGITVPDESDDGKDYQYFKQQYATTTANIPVYLISGESSMYLNFEVKATDAENGETLMDGASVTWNLSKSTGVQGTIASATGKLIGARFGVGRNTINVEVRDSFYNYYTLNGEHVYNDMCVATYSTDFYLWQSYAEDLPKREGLAKTLYDCNSDGTFYVCYDREVATYVEMFQIDLGVNPSLSWIIPGFCSASIPNTKIEGETTTLGTTTAKVITILQRGQTEFEMLTNSPKTKLEPNNETGSNTVAYFDAATDSERKKPYVAPYSLVKLRDQQQPSTFYYSFGCGGGDTYESMVETTYPNNDANFPKKILSMTYASADDNTAGAMLLKDWNGKAGTIAAYHNKRLRVIPETTNAPLSFVDGASLNFSENSKIRYLYRLTNSVGQRLFFTDTNNNRIIRISEDFGEASSIIATKPIDICATADGNKYMFSLSESGAIEDNEDRAISFYAIDSASSTVLTRFGKFADPSDKANLQKRAGKVLNPKSIIYYVKGQNKDYFGGLIILEEGSTADTMRIQVIRSNLRYWLE